MNIAVLTGAGISKESGIPTFRDAGDGLWSRFKVEEVASIKGFSENPELVWDFHNMLRTVVPAAQPNDAHRALAEMEARNAGEFTIITQNVDDLHERAGSKNVIHIHGELGKAECTTCGVVGAWDEDLTPETVCPICTDKGTMRPHMVWFGEELYRWQEAVNFLARCEVFVAIGTSGRVFPAADFVQIAREAGAVTVEINPDPDPTKDGFHHVISLPATEGVRRLQAILYPRTMV